MDRSKIALIIPAFNEEGTIRSVVKNASKYGDVIVVNDGSSDRTAALAEQEGAVVVNHMANSGYDVALNSGFSKAICLGYETLITLDADGQHDPSLINDFIASIEEGADIVLGVRNERPRLAEYVFSFYAKLRYGIHDPLCGMKAYRREVYESLGYFDSYNSTGTELAFYGLRNGFKIKENYFSVKPRLDQPRFGRILSANSAIFRSMFYDIIHNMRSHKP